MTEHSYFHNGAAAGDAIEAPYSSELFSKIESLVRSSGDSYVFPGLDGGVTGTLYGDAPGAGTVRVQDGSAVVGGIFYRSSAAITMNIPANNSIYARMDRIIIRVDWATQTARLTIKTGRPALLPEPPELTQILGDIYEMPLYRYYLAAGATTVTGANDTSLLDERVFVNTALHNNRYATENIFPNSEFMSKGGTGALYTATTNIPAMWEFVGTPTVAITTKFPNMSRGTCISATVDAANYIFFDLNLASVTYPECTLNIMVEVLSGALDISYAGMVLKTVEVTNGQVEIVIRTVTDPIFSLQFTSAGTCSFKLGQITLSYGYIQAPFGAVHETILFGTYAPSVQTVNNGDNTRTLSLCDGVRAILARFGAKDSSSSTGATCFASIKPVIGSCDQLRVELGRHVNFYELYNHGIIGFVEQSTTNPAGSYQININATTIGTMETYLHRVGIVT